MPSATWNSAASTDMNNTANYTAVWDATYDLVWDATSVVNCSATAPVSCNSITVAAAYSGAWSISGQTLTVANGATWAGNGTLNLGNGITINGASGNLGVAATVGAVTASSCALLFTGTTGATLNNGKASVIFKNLTLGAGAKLTISGAAVVFSGNATLLTVGNNGTITNNTIASFAATANLTAWSLGAGYAFNGTGTVVFGVANSFLVAISLTSLTYTGTGAFVFNFFGFNNSLNSQLNFNGTFSFGGNVTVEDQWGYLLPSSTFATGTIFTCQILTIQGLNVTFNNTVFTCTSFRNGTTYDSANYTQNWNTASLSVSGNITLGSLTNVNPGTSTVTITNTSTITPNSKTFYNFIVNAAAKTITLSGSLTIASGGSVTVTAFTAFAGNQYIIFAGSGSITISTNVSNRLRTAVGGSTITWNTGANRWTFPAYTANDFGGTGPSLVKWQSASAGTQYNIAAPVATINVSYMEFGDANNSAGGTIYATDGTSVDNGNNVNIEFPAKNAKLSTSKISINMGM